MGKKISITVSLLTILLLGLATTSWSHKPLVMAGITISPKYPLMYGKPFHVNIHANVGPKAESATLDLKLSDGLQLIKGDLQVKEGDEWKDPIGEDVIVQINQPGTYELAVTCRISFKKDDTSHVLTRTSSQHFYAREDTIIRFTSRSEMEKAIRDSLVFPGVLERRTEERNYFQYFLQGAKMKIIPFTLRCDLAELTRNIPLYPDSTRYKELSGIFDSNQVALIRKYTLLYAPPRYDRIEYALSLDFMDRITKEQLQSMVTLVTKQITELYELDQKILRMKPSDERTKSLQDREVMLKKQTTERQAIITPELPVTH